MCIFIDLPGRFFVGGERRPGAGSAGGPAGTPHVGPGCSSAQASASRTAWAPAVARSGTSASAPARPHEIIRNSRNCSETFDEIRGKHFCLS